ncbi:MAG: VOC family protein [Candidatus Poribacteria bacterium]|nr:VOC family protein [Candidatus Poribacteria bacterium]MDE0087794.1 VOC family protein [Candidatus Poribacteria bacterium]
MAVTFHHVHLRCEDLDGAVSYYEKIFDGKVLETADVGGLKVVRMEIGGERIYLSSKLGDMEVEDTSGNPRWGLYQLAFTVEDLDATVEELQAKGAELDYLRPEIKRAFFKGPDNVQIELIEM